MQAAQTILDNLREHNQYLREFPAGQQSAYFEHLIAQALSHVLHLPFYTRDNDDASVSHRVVWLGSINNVSKAPQGPDAVAYAYGYSILIEPTLKTGTRQWTQEFGPCCEHYEEFVVAKNLDRSSVYLLMIAPELNGRTWESVRSVNLNIVLMELITLTIILETSILACTMRHIEVQRLFTDLRGYLGSSRSLPDFREEAKNCVTKWQKDVLQTERITFVGVKSYETIRRIGRRFVSSGEIFQSLRGDPAVEGYVAISGGERLGSNEIEQGLLQLSLGYPLGKTPQGEALFSPVPLTDFKNREKRLVKLVEEINEQF